MKILTMVVALCLGAMVATAQDKPEAKTGDMKSEAPAGSMSKHDMEKKDTQTSPSKEDEAKAKPVGNTVCPVSGQKIGSMGEAAYIVYKGEKVALCCKGCSKTFMKDPAKYLRKAQKQAAMAGGKEGDEKKSGEKAAEEKM